MARESLAGSVIGGYSLEHRVGEGGTSSVYRAMHPVHGTVAVKVLRDKLRTDKTAVTRFLREADYGMRIVHPNIVRSIEAGETESGLRYLATEWAPGELLDQYVKRNGPIPSDRVVEIITQLADAVGAVHSVGIVHRDLKPENVMYDPESGRVKLLDFGIAIEPNGLAENRLTRSGFFVGTLMYVAPEALSGEIVTAAADQYSLGTIAYYLLTASHPHRGKTPRELFAQLLSQPAIPLNQARPDLLFPLSLESVLSRALAQDPQQRFPSVAAFADEFRRAAGGKTEAEYPKAVSKLRTFLRWPS